MSIDLRACAIHVDQRSVAQLRSHAYIEDLPECALRDEQTPAIFFKKNAQTFSQKVVRQFIKFAPAIAVGRGGFPDRFVNWIDKARFVSRIEISVEQHLCTLASLRVERGVDADFSFGNRAGLVGTEHVHAAEVFDRGEPLGDHFFLRHATRAMRKIDADDRGQKLRRQSDG